MRNCTQHGYLLVLWLIFLSVSTTVCNKEVRCPSTEIFLNAKIHDYKHCTVIEGHLHVIYHAISDANIMQVAFQNLTEITDYLLVFQITGGLTEIGLLFPSLTIIRGRRLLHNHALIIINNRFKLLNFNNLREISNGGVWIEHNPELCHVKNAIDWSLIVRDVNAPLKISNNRIICFPMCIKCMHCWSDKHCQDRCSSHCRAEGLVCEMHNTRNCCHPFCVGGCTGPGPEHCIACRKFRIGDTCVDYCPEGFYNLNDYRCVTADQCLRTKLPCNNDNDMFNEQKSTSIVSKDDKMNCSANSNRHYVLYGNHSCVAECPDNLVVLNDSVCAPCVGDCLDKRCSDITISSIEDLGLAKGCQLINRLKIAVSGEIVNFMEHLVEAFKGLREVRESIIITHSKSIVSLEFLRSLQRIRGCVNSGSVTSDAECTVLANPSQTVFEVSGNENLRELLWPKGAGSSKKRIQIGAGRLSFRLNRRLCSETILDFVRDSLDLPPGSELSHKERDLVKQSNGDLAICNLLFVNVSLVEANSTKVKIKLTTVPQLANSLVYAIVAYMPVGEDVKHLKRRSDCGDSNWSVSETACLPSREFMIGGEAESSEEDQNSVHCFLGHLRPARRYALYAEVKAAYDGSGGVTDMIFFHTAWDVPSLPREFLAQSLSPSEVLLRWTPPEHPNGHLDKYVISISREPLARDSFSSTDFCNMNLEENSWSVNMNSQLVLMSQYSSRAGNHPIMQPSVVHNLIEGKFCTCSECSTYCAAASSKYGSHTSLGPRRDGVDSSKYDSHGLAKEQIMFDDYITGQLLMGLSDQDTSPVVSRFRRAAGVEQPPLDSLRNATSEPPPAPAPPPQILRSDMLLLLTRDQEPPDLIVEITSNRTHFIVTNLTHFTEYSFRIAACQSPSPNDNNRLMCSSEVKVSHWTLPAPHVDHVRHFMWSEDLKRLLLSENDPSTAKLHNKTMWREMATLWNVTNMDRILLWKKPAEPNGDVLHFSLRYRVHHNIEVNSTTGWNPSICISRQSWSQTLRPFRIPRSRPPSDGAASLTEGENDTSSDTSAYEEDIVGGHSFANFAPADYEFQIMAVTLAGNSTWSASGILRIEKPPFNAWLVLVPSLTGAVACLIIFVPLLVALKCYLNKRHNATLLVLANPEYSAFTADWCIPRDNLTVLDKEPPLGKGSFGMVFQGVLHQFDTPVAHLWLDRPLRVAVKTLAMGCDVEELRDFLSEANMMKSFTAPHVVQFLGLVKPVGSRMKDALRMASVQNGTASHKYTNLPTGDGQSQPRTNFTPSPHSGNNTEESCATQSGAHDYVTFATHPMKDGRLNELAMSPEVAESYARVLLQPVAVQRFAASGINAVSPLDPLVVMELMQLGDLASYLRREGDRLSEGVMPDEVVLRWSAQIADGMFYLSQQHCVHRDLAARNCLLNADLTVKIGDFGLARRIGDDGYYRKHGRGKLPIRWMSPEALKTANFTEKSDVWSYGVVLWEVATLASLPYYGMDNEEVLDYVLNKRGHLGHNGWPGKCPSSIINLMSMCWEFEWRRRPSFDEVLQFLEPHVSQKFRNCSYFHKHATEATVVEHKIKFSGEINSSVSKESGNISNCDNSVLT